MYGASKHAVLSLTETLSLDLRQRRAKIGASVLCPGVVNTNIGDSERNRPGGAPPDPAPHAAVEFMRRVLPAGMAPTAVAEQVFAAVRDNVFYILPHAAWDASVRERVDRILARERPMIAMTEQALSAIRERGEQF